MTLALAAPATAQDMPTALPNNYVLSDILNKQRVDAVIHSGRSVGHQPPRFGRPAGGPGRHQVSRVA